METAFGELFEVVKEMVKQGWAFKEELPKMRKKMEDLEPLIKEVTRLNVELDLSRNNADILEVLSDGAALLKKLSVDGEKSRLWKYPGNARKLVDLDAALDRLMEVINAQGIIVGMLNLRQSQATHELLISRLTVTAPPVPTVSCSPLAPPRSVVGLDTPLRQLAALVHAKDVHVVLVVAPPGCGKTTLLRKLCQNQHFKESFKGNILYLTLSRTTPNLREDIVAEICKHYGHNDVPNFRDDEAAYNFLERLLSGVGPVLLVLDNAWPNSESLISRLCFNIPGYKMLIASRSEIQQEGRVYKLEAMSNDDAVALLSYHASLKDTTNSVFNSLVLQVVKRCKRCPLALELIGKALKGKSPAIWRRKLNEWSKKSLSILDTEQELLKCLQSSVDFLAEKDHLLKECFIDVGSFPEGQRIAATTLIDSWTELYEIDEETASGYLLELNEVNMATLLITRRDVEEDDEYYSEHFVTVHDMLRELALHYTTQNSGNVLRLVLELPGNNMGNANPRFLSISTDGMLSSELKDVQVSETQVLVLNFTKNDPELIEFLEKAKQLKVLIVTNYGFYLSKLLNFQIVQYWTNLKKMRFERVEIPSFTSIKLHNLQKLTFFMCKMHKAFGSLDISKLFPNLEEMHINYCSDLAKLPDGVQDLAKMKTLSVTHCHKLSNLPNEIGRMSSLEIVRLRSCIALIGLPASFCNLTRLKFVDISECFSIKNLPEDIGNLSCLEKLNMKGCSRIQDLPASVLDFQQLLEVVCDEDIKELWESLLPNDSSIQLTLAREDINLNFL